MATIFVRHPVADYAVWRPHYDSDLERRTAAGLREIGVFRNSSNPNDILMVFSANDSASAKAMMADEGLKAKMQEAGVTGPPEVHVAE